MKFSAIMAASLATANAVTQSMQQIGAGATTETEGHMQETVTNVSYQVDLDSIQAEIEAWYSDVASPFIGDHKDMVYKAALAEMEKKHGALLETCDEGTACRERYIAELKEKVTEIWKLTLQNFRETIEGAVLETRTEVEKRWVDLEACQVDHPCCSVSEIFWLNNIKKIKQVRSIYSHYVTKWFEFDLRRIEIEHVCPITIDYECAAMGACWDGSARDVDFDCECPEHYPPACPSTPCRNGLEHREPNTCKCINEFPSNAFNVYTEYVSDPESVVVTFDDLNGKQELEGYFIYLQGHRVHCEESQELINEHMKCTVPLGVIMAEPWSFNYGDLVQAQIADVHDGQVESELSELGGTAVIPERAIFIEKAAVWEGEYVQITVATVNDENPVHESHAMEFKSMYVGENIVSGEGTDDVGYFTLQGSVKGLNVAFDKQYVGVDGYIVGRDWHTYEGTLDQTSTIIAGVWKAYVNGEKAVYNGITEYGKDFYSDRFSLHRY
jgi:hypothetical protein